jgi:predicted ribosomally synthesized peptide with SipW-like signal peptide
MTVLQKNKKLAAGIGVAAAAAAVLAVGAGTYASFTDTEDAPSTTFAAGTLDLTVGTPVAATPVVLTNLAPGSEQAISVPIDNVGSVDGTLTATYTVTGSDNTCAEPETDDEGLSCDDDSELLQQLDLFYKGNRVSALTAGAGQTFTLDPLPSAPGPTTVDFVVKVPTTAGNEIMTDDATMTLTFTLTQK